MTLKILVRGGGDLASGVIIRLWRAGWQVLVAELPQPLAVRRYVSFAQAVYEGDMLVEDVPARRVDSLEAAQQAISQGLVPVLVDPQLQIAQGFAPEVVIDARMRKQPPEGSGNEHQPDAASLVVGLGPGFTAGLDCHAVIETNRGPFLGRVIWEGQAQADTGIPERVGEFRAERVLRAPRAGSVEGIVEIGTLLKTGDLIARVGEDVVAAPFDGVLRGLVQSGLAVRAGEKIGDLDPRSDPRLCWLVSEKSLAIGGGVLEAILIWMHRRRVHHEE